MEEQVTEQQQAEQKQLPELTITDLINCRTIIDVAVKRGTFSAGEVAGVGSIYNKLDTFIVAVTPAKTE
jgi:hypothetical protein